MGGPATPQPMGSPLSGQVRATRPFHRAEHRRFGGEDASTGLVRAISERKQGLHGRVTGISRSEEVCPDLVTTVSGSKRPCPKVVHGRFHAKMPTAQKFKTIFEPEMPAARDFRAIFESKTAAARKFKSSFGPETPVAGKFETPCAFVWPRFRPLIRPGCTTLADFRKAKALKRSHDLCSRNPRELRHARAREP